MPMPWALSPESTPIRSQYAQYAPPTADWMSKPVARRSTGTVNRLNVPSWAERTSPCPPLRGNHARARARATSETAARPRNGPVIPELSSKGGIPRNQTRPGQGHAGHDDPVDARRPFHPGNGRVHGAQEHTRRQSGDDARQDHQRRALEPRGAEVRENRHHGGAEHHRPQVPAMHGHGRDPEHRHRCEQLQRRDPARQFRGPPVIVDETAHEKRHGVPVRDARDG